MRLAASRDVPPTAREWVLRSAAGVSGEETRWRQVEPGVIEAGWKMSGILLFKQNTSTFGTPEKPGSLRRKIRSVSKTGF